MNNSKTKTLRREFLRQFSFKLMNDHLKFRGTLQLIPRSMKERIKEICSIEAEFHEGEATTNIRGRCGFCGRKKIDRHDILALDVKLTHDACAGVLKSDTSSVGLRKCKEEYREKKEWRERKSVSNTCKRQNGQKIQVLIFFNDKFAKIYIITAYQCSSDNYSAM